MIVEFVGRSRADADNITANPARLVNLYREAAGDRFVLKSVPGMVQFADLNIVLGRATSEINAAPYYVAGGFLYRLNSAGSVENLGAVADDVETFIDGYTTNVTIAAGGNYYVYNGTSLSAVAGGAFDSVGSVCFLSGYTILTEKNGSRFEWTSLQAPETRNALNVATAEGRDDTLLRGLSVGGNLYLFGKRSVEIWGLTGLANQSAFSRLSGGVIDRGLKSANLAVEIGGAAFFVGDDNVAYLLSGASPQPVSDPAVETAIAQGSPTHCFYYEDEGHKFCVIRFSDRPAWVFDVSTAEWHERGTGNDLDPWAAVGAAKAFGSWIVIDETAVASKLQRSNADLGQTMLRKAVSKTLENGGARFRAGAIEMQARTGFSNIGRDAQLILRLSRDRGATWGAPKPRSIGGQGDYRDRAVWRAQGQFRTMTAEITMGDETDAPIFTDANVEIA